jgi:signal transduction histidine kinase
MAANIPLAESARSGKAVLVESPEAWKERYPAAYAPAAPNTSVAPVSSSRAWAAFPMHGESGVRGSMLWTFDHPRTFSDEDRRFMEAVAQQGAQALERARLREAEERARAEAEEANRAKSDFLARMSHDLRTPLNAIGGYAELMEEGIYGEPTAGQRQSIERIRRAQQHLLTLINDVLSFAKLEAGQVSVSVRRVPMTEILTELRALIEPQVAAKGLQLELSGDASDLVLLVDPDRVVQILGNLLTNAVKFTDAGGHLTLSWERVDDDVEIAVRDTGRGIPAERLRAIFDPFVQIDGPEHGARQGVGLGLAIGRELARMLKGDLRVESRVGEGSTFTLRLPLERSARPEPAEMQAAL